MIYVGSRTLFTVARRWRRERATASAEAEPGRQGDLRAQRQPVRRIKIGPPFRPIGPIEAVRKRAQLALGISAPRREPVVGCLGVGIARNKREPRPQLFFEAGGHTPILRPAIRIDRRHQGEVGKAATRVGRGHEHFALLDQPTIERSAKLVTG